MLKSLGAASWLWFGLTLGAIAVCTWLGPSERALGSQVRVVYLHGAWVWTALAAFVASGVAGLVGLLRHQAAWLESAADF